MTKDFSGRYCATRVIEVQNHGVKSVFIFKVTTFAEKDDKLVAAVSPHTRDSYILTNLDKNNLSIVCDGYDLHLLEEKAFITKKEK